MVKGEIQYRMGVLVNSWLLTGEEEAQGNLIALYNDLDTGFSKVGFSLFSQV